MKRILIVMVALIMIGCASRKVTKTTEALKVTEAEVSKDTISTKKDIKEKHIEIYTEYEYLTEPIDTTKPFIINGQTFKNVRFKAIKKRKLTHISKEDNSVINQSKTIKKDKVVEMKKDTKDSERTSGFPWWIIIVIIILGGGLFYYEYKKK